MDATKPTKSPMVPPPKDKINESLSILYSINFFCISKNSSNDFLLFKSKLTDIHIILLNATLNVSIVFESMFESNNNTNFE